MLVIVYFWKTNTFIHELKTAALQIKQNQWLLKEIKLSQRKPPKLYITDNVTLITAYSIVLDIFDLEEFYRLRSTNQRTKNALKLVNDKIRTEKSKTVRAVDMPNKCKREEISNLLHGFYKLIR